MRSFSNSLIAAAERFATKCFCMRRANAARGGCVIIFPQTPDTGGACTKQASERKKPTAADHLSHITHSFTLRCWVFYFLEQRRSATCLKHQITRGIKLKYMQCGRVIDKKSGLWMLCCLWDKQHQSCLRWWFGFLAQGRSSKWRKLILQMSQAYFLCGNSFFELKPEIQPLSFFLVKKTTKYFQTVFKLQTINCFFLCISIIYENSMKFVVHKRICYFL